MKRLSLSNLSRIAPVLAVAALSLAAPAAHAAGGYVPNGNQVTPSAAYTVGDPVSNGVSAGMQTYGSSTDQQVAAVDYGEMNNIFLTRGTSVAGAWAIAGSVLACLFGGVGMLISKLRGGFSH